MHGGGIERRTLYQVWHCYFNICLPPQHKFSKITITPDRITLGGSNATESPIYVKVVCSKCNTTVDVTSKAKFSRQQQQCGIGGEWIC